MGPLLFLTLINQVVPLVESTGAKMLLYADDACILASNKAQLSQAIKMFISWTEKSALSINKQKSGIMRLNH